MLENGTAICATSLKSREVKLQNELEAAKKHANDLQNEKDELDEKFDGLNVEFEIKKKELQTMSNKYSEQLLAKRKLQKLKNYYRNRITQLMENSTNHDIDYRIQELKNEVAYLENEKEILKFELNNFVENRFIGSVYYPCDLYLF